MTKLMTLIFFILTFNASATTFDGVVFSDTVKVDGKDLVLNGIGIRKATFLKIKVYYGGLYLEKKTKDPSLFLNSTSPKQIIMQFVREVDAKKLRDGFIEGMEAANKNHDSLKSSLDKFNAQLTDVVKNDVITITFHTDGVVVNVKGKISEKIMGADFSKALLNIWFTNPRDENLKLGLLGQ